jgi:hypothetical protein
MPDNAHDMDLITVFIDGVAHGFAVNGQAFVLLAIVLVPALQCTIKVFGPDADKNVADDIEARDVVAFVTIPTPEAASGLLAEIVFSHNDKMREARLGRCQPGRIRNRLLLVSYFSRSY